MVKIDIPNPIDGIKCGENYSFDFKVQVYSEKANVDCCFYLLPPPEFQCYFLVPDPKTNKPSKQSKMCITRKNLHASDGEVVIRINFTVWVDFKNDKRSCKVRGTVTDGSGYTDTETVNAVITC